MAIIQKINNLLKKKNNFLPFLNAKTTQTQKFNPLILISFLVIFSCLFIISSNLIKKKNKENVTNFNEITENSEFSNLTNFLISKINSPYEEISYVIKNNDTVEKILKTFKIRNEDIRIITIKLKKKNLLI